MRSMVDGAVEKTRIVKVAEIISGHPFRQRIKDDLTGRIRVVQMKDVSEAGSIDWDSTVRTNLKGRRSPDWLKQGDILLLIRGAKYIAVHLSEVPVKAVCSPHFLMLRVKTGLGLLSAFLAWQLNQPPAQKYFARTAEGSVHKSIRRAVLEDFIISIPDLTIQKTAINMAECARKEFEALEALVENKKRIMTEVAKRILR